MGSVGDEPEDREDNIFSVHARYGSEVITVLESDGTMRHETPTIYRLLGHRPEDVEGTDHDPGESKWTRFVHPEDTEEMLAAVAGCLATPGEAPPVEYRIRHADGSWRWFESRGVNLVGDPRVRGVVVSTRDITDRKRAEEETARSERRLRAVADSAPVVLFSFDTEGTITFDAGRGMHSLGLTPGSTVGLSAFEIYKDDPKVLENMRRALAGEEIHDTVELDGSCGGIYFDTRYSPLRNATGEVEGVVGVATDITNQKRLEEELSHRANHDPLTGTPNRQLFGDRLEHALARSQRSNLGLAVLFIDLDDFKPFNDRHGHEIGDELLVAVARRLSECLRPEDTICRLGGDEFVVLLEDTDRKGAISTTERVSSALQKPLVLGGEAKKRSQQQSTVTASIGVALSEPDLAATEIRPAQLLREADAAMYRAKQSGKARYELSEPNS